MALDLTGVPNKVTHECLYTRTFLRTVQIMFLFEEAGNENANDSLY